ncbi:MAG: glycoside hydrolase family 73 protein [Romboutsia sp.]|uniref:glycoside hydrolase family 73 protein n=1 Tax=Romboutsia sp. TaxID=1965302 RepID=UPI003F3B6E0A
MGRKKLKYLGRNKKIKKLIRLYRKKICITMGVAVTIITLFNITNYIEKLHKKETSKKDVTLDEENKQFIESIEKEAKKSYEKYGIYPSITIAQAILESGWGKSKLSTESNNVFGIKADASWQGEYVEVITSENYNDKIVAKFRQYDHIDKSIEDHAKFLVENPRYERHGVFDAKNYKEQAQALEDAGYSTKKDEQGNLIYADMLIDLIERYNLQNIDKNIPYRVDG